LKLKKPAVFPAAGIKTKNGKITVIGGSCRVLLPDRTNWPCYECQPKLQGLERKRATYTEEEKKIVKQKYGVDLAYAIVPSLASLNDVVSGFALWEIEKILTGIDDPCIFQFYDALAGESGRIDLKKNPQCPACGKQKTTQELDELEQSLRNKLERSQSSHEAAFRKKDQTRIKKVGRWVKKKMKKK
jgi:hypothetical protein